ncbi:MAG: Protein kinase [Polyangiaceae bacterium]|jgi:serine/threonine-protein kinase|nr:Protein kinase [Polyangiaceae bacterium]
MAAPRLAPGTVLSGRYQVGEMIGESDLSVVYSATDQRGPANIALKVFDPAVKARAAALSEYQSLARQASGLGVEGIARAYDFGIDANSGLAFSTAELIGWASLDRRVLAQGPLGVADLARALGVLGRALDAAHATGLLHRDLKPQNVFISPENPEWARLTDFGVGAVRRGAPEAMGWGGPPGYTPPDSVDAAAPSSPGADLFALGVIAFFALTRGTPFRSLRSATFDPNAHWSELNQPLPSVSERAREIGVALDPALDPWFSRALARSPQERFRSAGEMARELTIVAEQLSLRGGGGPRSMPGIAAAIAQPLVFQPEPSPSSLGLAPTSPITTAAMAAVATAGPALPSPAPTLVSSAEEPVAPPRKKSLALPLMIGLGVVLLSGLALAGYAVLGKSDETAAALSSASAVPAAAPAPQAAVAPSATSVVVASGPAKARFTCQPQACESVVCDGKNVAQITGEVELEPGRHECSASRGGFASTAVTFTASAGQTSAVQFELSPLPPAKAAAAPAPAKPAATATSKPVAATPSAKAAAAKPAATPTAKPAASTAAKPTASAKAAAAAASAKAAATSVAAKAPATSKSATTKKKCSTFLGCK